jgi:hypothetical protein
VLNEDQLRIHIVDCISERDYLREQLSKLIKQDNEKANAQFITLTTKQAVILGKLGGLYIALGIDPVTIHRWIADPYWCGVGDKAQVYDPEKASRT